MDKIIYNISSYNRGETLTKTIESVYNQCDIINIVLNNYEEIPDGFFDSKINIFLADNEKGDAYKFLNLESSNGYFFTIDDDIIYPQNYSDYMINKVEQYNRKSIITLHGKNFNSFPISGFYNNENFKLYWFQNELTSDIKVQFGGTGVMCFHTDLMKFPLEYFSYPNMADVWIGKYAIENNLNIHCVEHPKDFVTQQNYQKSIYRDGLKEDRVQTIIVNEIFSKKYVSVIIPTFDNVKYLDECLDSIVESMGNIEGEILVGIDSCPTTLEYILKNTYDIRIKFYYFDRNVGPYVIKNSLSEIARSEFILFFDSDDIMNKGLIHNVIKDGDNYDFCRFRMINFQDGDDYRKLPQNKKIKIAEGVFAIKKDIFLDMNGFEPWRCAADSDFMTRLYKNNYIFKEISDLAFYRRKHSENLTIKSSTSYGSELRRHYVELMNKKTSFEPLPKLHTEHFKRIVTSSYISDDVDNIVQLPETKTEDPQNILLSFLEKKRSSPNVNRKTIQEKREYINTFNRFTPPKRKKK